MNEQKAQGLAALLADVLCADRPAPELLVRYVVEPDSLTPAQLQELEALCAHTPGCRTQLSLLQRFLDAPK